MAQRISFDELDQMIAAPPRPKGGGAGATLSFDDLDAMLAKPAAQPAPPDPMNQPQAVDHLDPSMMTEAGMAPPRPTADPELANFYARTSRLERITGPLQAGGLQVQQNMQTLGADIAGRQLDTFGRARSTQPGQPGAPMGGMLRAMRQQSPEQAAQTQQTLQGNLDTSVRGMIERQADISAIPTNPALAAVGQAKTWSEAAEQFWRDPLGVIQGVTFQSLPQAAPALGASLLTGPVGGAAVAGGTGFLSEYASFILEELQRGGVDTLNPEALAAAIQDPVLMGPIRQKASTRGAIVGSVEAGSMGLASRTLAPQMQSQLARQAINIPAQAGAQGTAAGAGEVGAQLATHGEVYQPGAALLEAVGEAGTAPADVAGLAAHRIGAARLPQAQPSAPRERIEPTLTLPPPEAPMTETPPPLGGIEGLPPQPAPTGVGTRPAPAAGGADVVVTPRGRRVEVAPEIVEASELVTSHTDDMVVNPAFPADLQPRDRERAASAAQVSQIAGSLQPELLGLTGSSSDGAPIVGPDSVVESGNARTLAIARAYKQGLPGAEAYRSWLGSQGYNVEGFKQPVLVRRRLGQLSPEDRAAFTREANERTTLSMSASEQAMTDAKGLDAGAMSFYAGGDLTSAANTGFVRRFMRDLSAAERGALFTPEGGLSQEGLRRIENALFARAYGDPAILAQLREQTDTNIKGIGDALTRVAGELAKLNGKIELGQLSADLKVSRPLLDAAKLVQKARNAGIKVRDLVGQGDMFAGGPDAATKAALRLFFRDDAFTRPRSSKDISDALRFYVDQAERNQPGPGLFPGQQQVSAADILDLSRQRIEGGLLPDVADSRSPSTGRQASMSLDDLDALIAQQPAGDTLPDTAESRQNMTPGANYVGNAPDRPNLNTPQRKQPLRREKILDNLATALEAFFYEGRVKGKATLGFYRKHIEEIRSKRANDLETVAHEALGHLLDDRFPEIRAQWLPASNANKTIRAELQGVSYDKSKLFEGFAEFMRLWSTQDAEAQARAPNFYAWFEGWLANTAPADLAKALREFKQQSHDWFNQHALDRMRSKIGDVEDVAAGKGNLSGRVTQSLFDDLYGIKAMEEQLDGAVKGHGPYITGRLLRGASSIIDGILTIGTLKTRPDGSHYFDGKSLVDILKPVRKDIEGFKLYAVGRAADELRGQGREHLFSPSEINAALALETPAFRQAFAEFQDWNQGILDFAEAKGVINPDQRKLWQRTSYLPFHRVGSGGPNKGFSRVSGQFSGIKKLLGGTDNINDPLQNILRNSQVLVRAALANEVRQKVAELASYEGGGRFMVKIPTEERAVKVHVDQIKQKMREALPNPTPDQEATIDEIVDQLAPIVSLVERGLAPSGKNVIAVLNNGKPTYYEVADDLLMRAMMALERKPAVGIVRLMNIGRSLMQKSITSDPDFIVKNFVRDQVSATALSGSRYIPFATALSGLKSRVTMDKHYRDYIANGGAIAGMAMDDADLQAKVEGALVKAGVNPRTVVNSAKRAKAALGEILSTLEVATRLGEYKKAVSKGMNPRQAAYEAREVSTDFSMRGDSQSAAFAYDTFMFLLATVNGMARLARGVRNPKTRKTVIGVVGALTALSVALHLRNMGTDEYEELSDFDKDTFYHIMFRRQDGSLAHWRFPKVWELSMPGTVAERIMDAQRNQWDRRSFGRIAEAFGTAFGLNYMPAVVQPLVERMANKRLFGGTPIESEGMQSREPWARFSAGTSESMRKLGEATRDLPESMQISPAKAEHLVRAYGNAFGAMALRASDWLFFDKTAPDMRLDQYPVVKTFYRDKPDPYSQHVTDLYESIRKMDDLRNTLRRAARTGRSDIADEIVDRRPELAMQPRLKRIESRLNTFHREMETVRSAQDIGELRRLATDWAQSSENKTLIGNAKMRGQWDSPGALKRVLLDDITRERNAFAARFAKDVRAERQELRAR